ncbi:hypothetical protein Patl1_22200 [Pistacia atlantica]|uniref:Uncharacterized protein n=1 Tax=Pistacia atlantica TaxID=434234 RepID=A0ACC1BHF8_9ROSI|nr:hypothetical protein Patl1_22200 [Pistacia atlantica]
MTKLELEMMRKDRVESRGFLTFLLKKGRMVEFSCIEHEKYAAGSPFVTQTVGRVLERFGVESSLINTKGIHWSNWRGWIWPFEPIKKDLYGRQLQLYRKQLYKSQLVIQFSVETTKKRAKAMSIAGGFLGVESSTLKLIGEEQSRIEVIEVGLDAVELAACLRKKVGHSFLVSLIPVNNGGSGNYHPIAPNCLCDIYGHG